MKCIRLAKDIMYHKCEPVERCGAGTSESFPVKFALHCLPLKWAENVRKQAPSQMMFADDVVLCARDKNVLELELDQWREALEKIGITVLRANTE